MKRRIGVRAHDYGRYSVKELLRAIAGDGWQAVQLAFPKAVEGVKAFADVSPELIVETAEALAETGLHVAVLGVYIEPSLTRENLRVEQARTFCAALPQAAALKAGCVGTETTSMKKQPGATRKEALAALRRSLEEILPEAERLKVNVAVEPVHYHALSTPELTARLLRDMASERLKVIFDPVNLLRQEDIAAQDALWTRCIDCFGESIAAVHIKGASHEADADGVLRGSPLTCSAVDYELLFSRLRGLEVPFLRELAVPSEAEADIDFLRGLLEK